MSDGEDRDRFVGRVVAGYEIVEPLGSGGFATVYRAREPALAREVALKVLDPALVRNANVVRRFRREGQSAARLEHRCIVEVYGSGEDDGLVYLAMRLVDGYTLADVLEARPERVPDAPLVTVVRAVTSALDHAHAREIVHRDVKPSNVLIGEGRVFLADFGIAVSFQEVGLYTAGAIGTVAYMSPEQAGGTQLDGRADLYSLGCVIYECITTRPPYSAESAMGVLTGHLTLPIPSVGDPALDRFFARALAKDPADRFPTGAALAAAFEDAIRESASVSSSSTRPAGEREVVGGGPATGDPVPGPPIAPTTASGPAAPAAPDARRGPLWLAAAGIVLFAVVVAAVIVVRARSERGAPPVPPVTQPEVTAVVAATGTTTSSLEILSTTVVPPVAETYRSLSVPSLPSGWTEGTKGILSGSYWNFDHDGRPAALVVAATQPEADLAVTFQQAGIKPCPTTPTATTIGSLPAGHCVLDTPGGKRGETTEYWLTQTGPTVWLVVVGSNAPPRARDAFVTALQFRA